MRSNLVIRGTGQRCGRKRGVSATVKNLVSSQIMTPREKCERKRRGESIFCIEKLFLLFGTIGKVFPVPGSS